MNPYLEKLKTNIEANRPNFGDCESVLAMLYECYNENNPYDNDHQIREDFHELYQQMNGMPCGKWTTLYILFVSSAGIMRRLDLSKGFAWAFS